MDDPNTPHNTSDPAWERHLLDKVVMASFAEQRAKRRWGIFQAGSPGYFVAVLVLLVDWGYPEKLSDGKRIPRFVYLHRND